MVRTKMTYLGIVAASALALVACDKKSEGPAGGGSASAGGSAHAPSGMALAPSAHASGSAAAAASAPAAPATPTPPWYAKAPAKPVAAKAGDVVWAVHANSSGSGAWMTPVEVVSAAGNAATLRDLALMASGPDSWKLKPNTSGTTYAGVPGSAIAAARNADAVKPKAGDIVWAGITNGPHPDLVKVSKVDGGLVVYERLNAMMKELDKDLKAQYVEPYGKGIAPFTYAAIKSGDAYKLMLVLGVDGDNVYGQTFDDFTTAKKSDVKPLVAAWKARKKGDKVLAFSSGGDGKVVTIETVPMEKWVFKAGPFQYAWNLVFDAP
jgi:hypothetical protein